MYTKHLQAQKKYGFSLDISPPIPIMTYMKTRNIILLVLALVFNDFVGSLVASLGCLFVKLGSTLASIPELF